MASCSRQTQDAEGEMPNWLELPREVTTSILQNLSVPEIVMNASQVCSLWWNICMEPMMWRTIDMTNLFRDYPNSELVKICYCSVKRSCGQLEDVSIERFATDDLLKYIAQSSFHLCRVRLLSCRGISDEGMADVAKKLPQLEELDISISNLSKKSLEAIGRCCPLLKELTFSLDADYYGIDEEAFAIAKTMAELRHLRLLGYRFSYKGFLAILDGCPLLEYLDLRGCIKLDLSGNLGKRFHKHMKEIMLPLHFLPWDHEQKRISQFIQSITSREYRRGGE